MLLPGIMAISMVFTGVWAVAMPLIAEFQFTREIEDRLLAPMEISWLAVEKVLAGTLQALIAGLVVIPAAWVILRPGVERNVCTVLSPLPALRCWWLCSPPAAVLPWAAALISNILV